MIQNISGSYEKRENLKNEKSTKNIEKIDVNAILTNLFTWQNIAIYIITFLVSMCNLGQSSSMPLSPFGLAMVAASVSTGIPIAVVYISSLIGTIIKFNGASIITYIITSIVFLLLILIKKPTPNEEKTEQLNLGGYLFISVFTVLIGKMIITQFYMYDLMVTTVLSVATYVFYKIFVNSIQVISKYGIKKAFSIEEVVGASLLIAIATSALGNLTIFSFSIRNIICIFIILLLGYRNGILVGGVSGITVGIVLGIIGGGTTNLIAAYAISGMLAGLLNRFGKIGVIFGFALGNIIIAYVANGGSNNMIMFQEILIAAIGLLAVPKSFKINVEDIIPHTLLLPESTGRIEESADTILQLNSISKTVDEMSKNIKGQSSYDENLDKFQEQVHLNIQNLQDNILYEYIYDDKNNIIKDIFDQTLDNGILTDNLLIAILAKHNIYLMNSNDDETKKLEQDQIRQMLKALNSSFNVCKKDLIWTKKIDENNKQVSNELSYVKQAIDNITNNIQNKPNDDEFFEEKKNIKNSLADEKILLKDIQISKESSGRYTVKVYVDKCNENSNFECPIKKIQKIISNELHQSMETEDQKCGARLNKSRCEFTYISADKYLLQVSIAKAKKNNSLVSGDITSNMKLKDGKLMLAISDGMGSGPDALRNSKIAISMLERLFSSGFNKETAINLINSAIITSNEKEMYATLDIGIFDLYDGKLQILKNGACPTYIKNNNNEVSLIESNSLPTGILNNIKIDTFEKKLEDGTIIVMCSDGIIDSNKEYANHEIWLKELLENIQTDIPEKIADIILKESIDNDIGKPTDDMTVIVSKILKK